MSQQHQTYDVVLRRVSDGLERTVHVDHPWDDDTEKWWWTDGNAGCDCNRGDDFGRAGGDPPQEYPCGNEAYLVVRVILPDGTTVDWGEVKEEASR